MKLSFVIAALLLSVNVFARQYIQCSVSDYSSTDVAVVNLPTADKGTFFLSSGMQNDESERILVQIEKEKTVNGKTYFQIVNEQATGYVILNTADLGVSSDYLKVKLEFGPYRFDYSCFSRIYQD